MSVYYFFTFFVWLTLEVKKNLDVYPGGLKTSLGSKLLENLGKFPLVGLSFNCVNADQW